MSDLKFKTDKIEFEDDRSRIEGRVSLSWSLEMDVREWGVKDIVVSVPSQKISVVGVVEDPDSHEDFPATFDIELDDVKCTGPDKADSIRPSKVYWDERRRGGAGWVVEFE